jgi:peroxiredoxin
LSSLFLGEAFSTDFDTMQPIINGGPVPKALLGQVQGTSLRVFYADQLFAYGRAAVVGIPGAFSPICTKRHLPEFIQSAEQLTAAGFSHLVCIAPNDPFVLQAWAQQIDPQSRIEFYSDGNLEFAGALGLRRNVPQLFMGWRSPRYLMVVADGVIQRLFVEKEIGSYKCTRPFELLA